MIESIDAEYINICIYSRLSASSYIKFPVKLRNSVKGLVNIKNNDNKCFLWCHIRHLNPLKTHSERITKADIKVVNDLDYQGIEFPVSRKDYSKIEHKNVYINVFCNENDLVYPVYTSNEKPKNCMNLLLNLLLNLQMKKCHIISTSKILTELCAIKQKMRIKNSFASIAYNVLVVKKFL